MSDIDWKKEENNNLVNAILSLKNKDEVERFLRDLLTKQEIEEFSRRFLTAKMLSDNFPYSKIIEKTGLSSTTIARISKWLNGSLGGYKLVINKLHRHNPSKLEKGLS
ncbi:MAG: YerC/YecD family TrpR-related protein [Patescibacteria group bacterium]|nr:YerC/YecD family TrpR-related protein [Patescibacteria group bacterium]